MSNTLEMVVRPHIRLDNLIDVCSEYGEVFMTISYTQWFYILKPVTMKGVPRVLRFIRPNTDYYLYSVSISKFNNIKRVLDEKKKD